MDRRFEGRVAIVTGASRGIGLAIAGRLVAEGGRVVVTGRHHEGLEEAVASLGGGKRAVGVAGHVGDGGHQGEVIDRALEAFGRIDLLVNNTGINPAYGRMIDLNVDAARKIVDVNVIAALSWTQRVFRRWFSDHGGAVVNTCSVAGLRPAPGIGMYGASKAMLTHVTQELALELAPTVRVNAVAPAVVKTTFATALYQDREEQVTAGYPMGRLGVPADVAGAVAYLASQDASWITGQVLVVDGGLTLTGGIE